jgi:hypothetical protein
MRGKNVGASTRRAIAGLSCMIKLKVTSQGGGLPRPARKPSQALGLGSAQVVLVAATLGASMIRGFRPGPVRSAD